MSGLKLDEWGHVETRKLKDGALGAVVPRSKDGMGDRVVLCKGGDPLKGYDAVWWYDSIPKALDALRSWDYPNKVPPNFYRDLSRRPVKPEEDG